MCGNQYHCEQTVEGPSQAHSDLLKLSFSVKLIPKVNIRLILADFLPERRLE